MGLKLNIIRRKGRKRAGLGWGRKDKRKGLAQRAQGGLSEGCKPLINSLSAIPSSCAPQGAVECIPEGLEDKIHVIREATVGAVPREPR